MVDVGERGEPAQAGDEGTEVLGQEIVPLPSEDSTAGTTIDAPGVADLELAVLLVTLAADGDVGEHILPPWQHGTRRDAIPRKRSPPGQRVDLATDCLCATPSRPMRSAEARMRLSVAGRGARPSDCQGRPSRRPRWARAGHGVWRSAWPTAIAAPPGACGTRCLAVCLADGDPSPAGRVRDTVYQRGRWPRTKAHREGPPAAPP